MSYTAEQLASRIRNIRAVENVMSKYAFLTACGESWGWAFLCLAFYAASKTRR